MRLLDQNVILRANLKTDQCFKAEPLTDEFRQCRIGKYKAINVCQQQKKLYAAQTLR